MTSSRADRPTFASIIYSLKRIAGLTHLKRLATRFDARHCRQVTELVFRKQSFKAYRSFYFNEAIQDWFDPEIAVYFDALAGDFTPRIVIDAGASSGLFSSAARTVWPETQVHAFEPSPRQRTLLERNMRLNGWTDVQVFPFALWNRDTTLPFKSVGAISSVEGTEVLPDFVVYDESVPTSTLDGWAKKHAIEGVDLIKMDIEGCEIEALEGARELLTRFRPLLLIQAYHLRDGSRTLERCAALLEEFGYTCSEGKPAGLLVAKFLRSPEKS